VLWFEDSRESETVHATELRWLRFDADARELNVHYVDFPPEWTQPARDLEDLEYSSNTDWSAVYTYYSTRGWIKSRTLIDQLGSCAATSNAKSAMNARCISFELEFEFADQIIPFVMTMQMSQHEPPIS
jgi:hypothetical protein